MKTKKIIISIFILGFIGAFVAYKMYNKPHVNVANEKADITLTANKILADFSTDETTANTKYLEKIVQVKGVVSKVEVENEIGIITLETNDEFGSVICHLTPLASKNITKIKERQELVLKGICTGYLMDVILVKSIIINKK
ncbi:MAG: hypothetical protein V3V28_07760 [Polaribacter sp.]|uniref:OB-fold protein n=1 Tax=Polaribacter sp. TaxID=1920175 RepID=UPI002F356442